MKFKNTRLTVLPQGKDLSSYAKTGVSLHCHTKFSREMLDFVPHYAEKIPIISHFWRKERDRYVEKEGRQIDFETAYWSPPLDENQVYSLEKNQLNNLGLDAIVSITDHDNIGANLSLNETLQGESAPISLEWTVPFDYGFFHLGVHNLPKSNALEISKQLLDYTFQPEKQTDEHLHELFAMLNELPEVLIVFNHPLWDIELAGKEKHEILLKNFIAEFGQRIHALEVNGFRSWSENKATIELAESIGMPTVTGGDRHGCQPNTVINLTNGKSFAEFAAEIRHDKHSEIVMLPEHSAPLHSRQLQSFSEILKYYDNFPEGRKRWFDRVYINADGLGVRQLSVHWKRGGPTWLRWAIKTLAVLGNPKLRPGFRLAMKAKDVIPPQLGNETQIIGESISTENRPLITDN
jgi:hypothetical protein